MPNELKTIDFHGDKIETFEANGERWVAMRRICENLGMAWGYQSQKLEEQREKFNCSDIRTVAEDGKTRKMLAIPTRNLALWLACINPNKVAEHVRPKLERYHKECAKALDDYWTKGVAINERAFPQDIREMLERMFGIERMLSHKVTEQGKIIEAQAHELIELRGMIEVNPSLSMPEFQPALEYLIEFGAEQQGRRALAVAFGNRMVRRANQLGVTDVWRYVGGKRKFRQKFARACMQEFGLDMIRVHNFRVRSAAVGQSVIQFVKPKAAK
jgi:hypothetical protein